MKRPNSLIFVIDSLRYDHTSLSGYKRETTPNLTRLAKDGIVFDNFHTVATWTRPVAASLLTGVYPLVHKVRHRDSHFSYNGPRLPQILQVSGYETFALSGIGQVSTFAGFDVGFTHFYDMYRDRQVLQRRTLVSSRTLKLFEKDASTDIALVRTEDLVENFQTWYQQRDAGNPFFGLIWSIDPHPPFEPPEEFWKFGKIYARDLAIDSIRARADGNLESLINLYDCEILYTDYWFGRLINYLKREGLYDDMLIIVLADHGEAWGRHGFIGHGQAPYQELLHVPLLIKYPGNQGAGKRVTTLADITDIMPTIIMELLGEEKLSFWEPFIQGNVLFPSQEYNHAQTRSAIFADSAPSSLQPVYQAIYDGQWKYIERHRNVGNAKKLQDALKFMLKTNLWREVLAHPGFFFSKYFSRRAQGEDTKLFYLPDDKDETQNRLTEFVEDKIRLQNALVMWREECAVLATNVPEGTRDFGADDVLHAHLQALGYME